MARRVGQRESSRNAASSKRGQFNTAFKSRFFVLSEAMLEYYEDEKAYEGIAGINTKGIHSNQKCTCDTNVRLTLADVWH